jgi:peroxiredoxin
MNSFRLFAIIVLFISCSSAQERNDNGHKTVSGKIENTGVGYVTLEYFIDGNLEVVDTLTVNDDGTYYSKFVPDEPGYYRLNFYDTQFVNIILTGEPIVVNVNGSGPMAPFEISGSSQMEALDYLNDLMSGFKKEVSLMNESYSRAVKNENQSEIDSIQQHYAVRFNEINLKIKDKIRSILPSVAVLQAINYLDKDQEFAFIDSVARVIDREMPDYRIKRDFIAEIDNMRKLAIGSEAPEIELPDPDGNIIKLSSLRGSYVLIDFWAAWCGPCRRENPNVVRLYEKYHSQGFEIYGVSLDRNKEDWIRAIEKDKLTWIHVSDLQYFNSKAAETYNIQAIPATYLIDKEGNIIGKNLRGVSLEEKLKEIFG